MLEKLLPLLLGGAAGTVCRYSLGMAVSQVTSTTFPYGTLAVNTLGCLLLGIAMGVSSDSTVMPTPLRLALITGFLGAFTTFSTFEYEAWGLLKTGFPGKFLMYMALSVVLGLGVLSSGYMLSRVLLGKTPL